MNSAAQILAALRSTEHGVSGTDLCRQLEVSRAAQRESATMPMKSTL